MGSFHFFALAIIAIGYSTAGSQTKMQPRIINGQPCENNKFPFFVILLSRAICGGSLVTYDWVLTAAHCIRPQLIEGVTTKIYSAFDMPPQLKQERNGKEFHMHPKYVLKDGLNVTELRYDIGLILLDEPFRQTAATQVATLPAPGFSKHCNRVMVPGIGITHNKEKVYYDTIAQRPVNCVDLSIMDTDSCKKAYEFGRGKLNFDTIMCMHEQRKGTCKGDSGGPVICDNVVIGIDSWGPQDCEVPPTGTVFTMVESYLDFIDSIVKFTGLKMKHA